MRFVREKIDDIIYIFTAENYNFTIGKPVKPRFPSLVTAVFRFLIKYVLFVLPVIWIAMLIGGIVSELPVVGVIVASFIGAALVGFAVWLVFMVLMGIESLAKHISSLIMYNELDDTPENPVDSFITMVLWGDQAN